MSKSLVFVCVQMRLFCWGINAEEEIVVFVYADLVHKGDSAVSVFGEMCGEGEMAYSRQTRERWRHIHILLTVDDTCIPHRST